MTVFVRSVGLLLVGLLSWFGRPVLPLWIAGAVLVVAGVSVRLWASGCIRKNKELATAGPYAFVRHPLYVGNLLLTVGFCLASNRWWGYLLMLIFWLVFYPTAIRDEDLKLRRLFGESWETWSQAVPALIPRRRPYEGQAAGGWSFRRSLRLNGEPIIALLLLACVTGLLFRLG